MILTITKAELSVQLVEQGMVLKYDSVVNDDVRGVLTENCAVALATNGRSNNGR